MKRNDMHELLLRHAPGISGEQHKSILDAMKAEGHFDGGDNGAVIRAAATGERKLLSPMMAMRKTELHPLLKQVEGQCRRNGFPIDFSSDQPINTFQLDQALRASGADQELRMSIKSMLYEAGLIPA